MKFKNIKNEFAPKITEFDISEKELEYVSMLAAGVERKRAMETLSMKQPEIRKLYLKLGLTEVRRKRYIQAVTLFSMNNIITDEIYSKLYQKYNLIECKEMVNNYSFLK